MKLLNITLITTVLAFSHSAQADVSNGQELHGESCVRCHGTDLYTRSNRNVNDIKRLGSQVRFCKDSLSVTWFDEDVSDVIDYLSESYYKF